MSTTPTGIQFGRVANLIVSSTTLGTGRDLSQMHFRFSVKQADNETPNNMVVTIYNLNDATVNEIISQYDAVALQVGYEGIGLQVIFNGTIKMFRRGKSNATDRFLEISAADNDLGYSYGIVNATLGPGASQADVLRKAAAAMGTQVDSNTQSLVSTGGVVFPRGKVLFGLARIQCRTIADTLGARWSSQAGIITFISNTGYLPNEAVVLSPTTGMIGVPEDTPDGINVRCLLNPLIKVGCPVQIAESDIVAISTTQAVQSANPGGGIPFPTYGPSIYPATVQRGLGIYRVVVAEHEGDTRELDWYSDLTCLAIDPTQPVDKSVKANG
jgi:hypothetical protein